MKAAGACPGWKSSTAELDQPRALIEKTRRRTLEVDRIGCGSWVHDEQGPVEVAPPDPDEHDATRTTRDRPPRLLYFCPVMPADSGNGLAMRAATMLRLLLRDYRVSLLIVPLYSPGPARELPDWVRTRCENVRWVPEPGPGTTRHADHTIGQDRLDAWVDTAARAYPSDTFDVIHVFRTATMPFAGPYLNRAAEWHLDLDDVESRVQERLARLYERHGRAGDQSDAVQRAEASARQEEDLLRAWDRIYVCSEQDRDEIQRRATQRRAEIVVRPNAVKLPDDPPPAPRSGCPAILFLGSFGYFPNVDAATWLCREILPVIREQSPEPVRLLLVGSGAPIEVRALAHIPEVEFVGEVPDAAPWYAQADVVVVPLRAGGGTRIKLLEALAYRRPVVSTSIGAEGLDLVDDEHLLIANRARHFGQQCLRLLGDAELAARLASAGRQRVEQRYCLREIEPFTELRGRPAR
ncbi:conserved hypothetical protein [Nitrolancea hollandica Lb]|uniref:Glycosyltransferase n=1 Tax=Nitrolancea hollandica Lb TaxID=1129897 RepID=I4EJB7_9BACT|nr:conserved hypothetical protein [Nitrolancea hollandica Lb]